MAVHHIQDKAVSSEHFKAARMAVHLEALEQTALEIFKAARMAVHSKIYRLTPLITRLHAKIIKNNNVF